MAHASIEITKYFCCGEYFQVNRFMVNLRRKNKWYPHLPAILAIEWERMYGWRLHTNRPSANLSSLLNMPASPHKQNCLLWIILRIRRPAIILHRAPSTFDYIVGEIENLHILITTHIFRWKRNQMHIYVTFFLSHFTCTAPFACIIFANRMLLVLGKRSFITL